MQTVFITEVDLERRLSHCGSLVHGRDAELGYRLVKTLHERARSAAFLAGLDYRRVRIAEPQAMDGGYLAAWWIG